MKQTGTNRFGALALTLLLLLTALATQAVNVTYSLKTHVDGRTMTQVASQTAGAALNLPKDMKRGYTDYTYYSDEALTQQITNVPSEDCTVYADYVFNPPFVLSTEDFPIPHVIGISKPLTGYNNLRSDGKVLRLGTSGYRHTFNLYGDAYCLWVQSSYGYDSDKGKYITWSESDHTTRVAQTERPKVGWQLIKNVDAQQYPEFSHFSLGTYEEGENNGKYFIYQAARTNDSSNVNATLTTDSDNVAPNGATTSSTPGWSMYVFISGQSPSVPYTITYRIIQDYPQYKQRTLVVVPMKNTVKVANPSDATIKAALDGLKETTLFTYTFYKDEAMTQQYGDDEYCAPDATKSVTATQSITVWVKETYLPGHETEYITDRWITICLPYGVSDVEDYFGEGAVTVNKFTGLEVTDNKYLLKFTEVNTMEPNVPYMFKAENVLEGKYLTLYKTVAPPTDDEDDSKYLSISCEQNGTQVSMRGTYNGKTLTYDDDIYQFYMGYKITDPEAEGYKEEQPNFYRVTTKRDVEIKPFRCWLDIADQSFEASSRTLAIGTDDETGLEYVIDAEGIEHPTADIYNLSGQLVRARTTDTDGLPRGLYIIGGKKVVVR